MRFSTRGRYGIRACLELAEQYGNGAVQISQVARNRGIPEKYLAQLFPLLRKSGLVKSVRGARGGYVLSRPPGEIRMIEIVEALEGPIAPVECVLQPSLCDRFDTCGVRLFWSRVRDSLAGAMDSMSLADLLGMDKEKNGGDSLTYCI